jgi:hypothetical protein
VARLRFGERSGPARSFAAGSGYWSQDSAVQVLATPQTPTAVWVRWPGGQERDYAITGDPREVILAVDGQQRPATP